MKMNKFIWIVCVVFVVVVDATFHQQCELSCPDDPSQGDQHQGQKGEKGESTKSCNCSAVAEVQQKLSMNEEKLSKTEEKLSKTEKELSELKQKPRDCYDVIFYNMNATSGVYTIFPPNYRPGGIEVWCDMDTDGGGWIVFQNRKDGSVDFYRGWKEYLVGFGDLKSEFWLGLEYIHELTKYGTYDLRIDMSDFEQHEAYAVYSSFSIGEGPGYVLKFADYFGDAGDSLTKRQLNHSFTTKDKDQDTKTDGNCAVGNMGAWWYGSCHLSNLNGQYLKGVYENVLPTDQSARGMTWYEWKGHFYSLKTANMKIRPNFANYA